MGGGGDARLAASRRESERHLSTDKRPSASPWAASIVIVQQKGKALLATDRQALNEVVRDSDVHHPT